MGATLGLGTVIGGTVGSALGGKAATRRARQADTAALQRRRNRLQAEISAYGKAIEDQERTAAQKWAEAVTSADASALARLKSRRADLATLRHRAETELRDLAQITPEEAAQLLKEPGEAVSTAVGPRSSPRARKDARRWYAARNKLTSATPADGGKVDVEEVLLLVAAAPTGERSAAAWLSERLDRRVTALGATDVLTTRIAGRAIED